MDPFVPEINVINSFHIGLIIGLGLISTFVFAVLYHHYGCSSRIEPEATSESVVQNNPLPTILEAPEPNESISTIVPTAPDASEFQPPPPPPSYDSAMR